jgi:hypothetical protein
MASCVTVNVIKEQLSWKARKNGKTGSYDLSASSHILKGYIFSVLNAGKKRLQRLHTKARNLNYLNCNRYFLALRT